MPEHDKLRGVHGFRRARGISRRDRDVDELNCDGCFMGFLQAIIAWLMLAVRRLAEFAFLEENLGWRPARQSVGWEGAARECVAVRPRSERQSRLSLPVVRGDRQWLFRPWEVRWPHRWGSVACLHPWRSALPIHRSVSSPNVPDPFVTPG